MNTYINALPLPFPLAIIVEQEWIKTSYMRVYPWKQRIKICLRMSTGNYQIIPAKVDPISKYGKVLLMNEYLSEIPSYQEEWGIRLPNSPRWDRKPERPMFNISNYWKTKCRAKVMLDNIEKFEGLQEILDIGFFEGYEIQEKGLSDLPYWIELDSVKHYTTPANWFYKHWDDIQPEDCYAEYQPGYYEPLCIGDWRGAEYVYIGSQILDEEIEHQCDNGECVYEYRGPSFFRIWWKVPEELLPEREEG